MFFYHLFLMTICPVKTAELRRLFIVFLVLKPYIANGRFQLNYVCYLKLNLLDLTFVWTWCFWASPVNRENSVLADVCQNVIMFWLRFCRSLVYFFLFLHALLRKDRHWYFWRVFFPTIYIVGLHQVQVLHISMDNLFPLSLAFEVMRGAVFAD